MQTIHIYILYIQKCIYYKLINIHIIINFSFNFILYQLQRTNLDKRKTSKYSKKLENHNRAHYFDKTMIY